MSGGGVQEPAEADSLMTFRQIVGRKVLPVELVLTVVMAGGWLWSRDPSWLAALGSFFLTSVLGLWLLRNLRRREARERRFYLETIDRLEEAVFEIDRKGVIRQMSRAWKALSGSPVAKATGKKLTEWAHPEDREELVSVIHEVLAGERQVARYRFRLLLSGLHETWVDSQLLAHRDASGTVIGVRGVLRDVTQLYLQEKRIARLALHDALTQLPNRVLLDDRIHMAFASARRNQLRVALGFIDLDNFKQVNDTLGHDAGDQVLCNLAEKLTAELRKRDTLARWGGDELVVLLTDLTSREEAVGVCERLLIAASHASDAVPISISIGLALFPDHADTPEALLKAADRAMFQAKHAGRNQLRVVEPPATIVPVGSATA